MIFRTDYDTEETTLVFLYHHDSQSGDFHNQDFLDSECDKLGVTNYGPGKQHY